MIQATSAPTPQNEILKFPTLAQREGTLSPDSLITLRSFYESVVLPEISGEQSENSLKEDRYALNHWERVIGDVDIRDVNRETIKEFRDGMVSTPGLGDATINKYWRELKAMFSAAVDEDMIPSVPSVGRRMRSKLVKKEETMRQREIITADEVSQLWTSCKHATYPAMRYSQTPAPLQWRVILVLFWTYGARTLDVFNLSWEDVQFQSKLIQFRAMKSHKLQGLPMTELVEKHLRSIYRPNAKLVFPGFRSHGCYLKKKRTWKVGYYTTWRTEIEANSKVEQKIVFKNFRQRVVNDYNAQFPSIRLGSWIAGHFMQGVSAVNYEYPTKEIREAIEAAPVPNCFHEVG